MAAKRSKKAAPKKAAKKKVAPKKAAKKKVAPKKAAKKKVAPKKTAPKKTAPKKTAPKKTAPKKTAPKKAAAPKKTGAPKKAAPPKKDAPPKLSASTKAEIKRLHEEGNRYYRAKGVPEDFDRARALYLQAAELGDVGAMSNLVMFYEHGTEARWGGAGEGKPVTGVDLAAALHWSREMVRLGQGYPKNVARLESLIANGPPPPPPPPGDEASQRASLNERIAKAKLGAFADVIGASVLPSLRLVRSSEEPRLGGSRLGGLPDLKEETEWPRGPKAPLSFIAQLDLAELAPLDAGGLLPREGLLSFFYDLATNPWGNDLEERAQLAVIHTPVGAELQRRNKPTDLVKPHKYAHVELTSTPVRPELELTLPSPRTKELRAFGLSEADHNRYMDEVRTSAYAWPTSKGVMHRVLGHPDANQGDMTRRLAYLFAGKPDAIDDAPDPVVEEDAARFRLLLQIDTDGDLMSHWGDGRLYVWIREDDLKANRFDAAFFQFQG